MKALTKLIYSDMRPALGVTEPGAIAFAVAKAREQTSGNLLKINLILNSGMYKNAFTCGIPNCFKIGNEYAAALGFLAADATLGLECLDSIRAEDNRAAENLVKSGKVHVKLGEISSVIFIHAEVITDKGSAAVTIRDSHTNITEIVRNGKVVFSTKTAKDDNNHEPSVPDIHKHSLLQIINYITKVPAEEIAFIDKAYELNLALFEQALHSQRTTITAYLYRENDRKTISTDEQKTASLLCNGAIEARVLGFSRPAMSITGSGAHGIIATLPLYASAKINNFSHERLLRATALSYLICMYIKEYSGKLSAFCGCAIAAGTGMACALAWLKGASNRQISLVIRNMASSITGMICDGGNHGCAMKGVVAVDAAYRAVNMALNDIAIDAAHGINGSTPEATMRNIGLIASPGMVQTEGIIVEIMREKMSTNNKKQHSKE
ncbi:MAG: serine dehydratase subunit alpha family protein [Bacteroidales bacterium]|nr:serine dehydratase subunit alpha family protein [Bacteroidales bacterium]